MRPWWKGAALYQIYPRSFLDSDGDGVGDLKGIAQGLDHVAALGVDGVWLSPFFKSPMKDFGYDVADYCDVDPAFGTLADFDALLARAHALGLKVVIDQVYSHTSDQHPWFEESRASRDGPKRDWYVWADAGRGGAPPNNWLSVFGGPAWQWDGGRRQYYLHNFLHSQPDLNFHEPAVQAAILDVARFWLERGVDGFRLDVVNYYFHDALLRDNPPAHHSGAPPRQDFFRQRHLYNCSQPENFAFIARLRALLDLYVDRFSVGEVFDDLPLERQIEYTAGPQRLHTAYSFHLLAADKAAPKLFADALAAWENEDGWPSWSLGNHDVARFPTRLLGEAPPPAAIKLLIAVLLSMRGAVFLYQGDELGLKQAHVPQDRLKDPHSRRNLAGTGRDGARTPFPWKRDAPQAGFSTAPETWLPVDPRHGAAALDAQQNDPHSIYHFTRALLALRKRHRALVTGGAKMLKADETILAFERRGETERICCVFNLSDRQESFPAPPGGRILPSGLSAERRGGEISLPPWGGALIRCQAVRRQVSG